MNVYSLYWHYKDFLFATYRWYTSLTKAKHVRYRIYLLQSHCISLLTMFIVFFYPKCQQTNLFLYIYIYLYMCIYIYTHMRCTCSAVDFVLFILTSSASLPRHCLDSICYHTGGPLTIGDIEDINGSLARRKGPPWWRSTETLWP